MIEKLDIEPTQSVATNHCIISKINELCDTVNNIQKERETERFEIQEWIAIIGDLRKQVRELQETRSENVQPVAETRSENVQDETLKCPFCQQELRPLAIGWCCDCGLCADKELWQRLIRTRKALETIRLHLMAAKGRFNFYDEYLVSGIDTPHARFIKEEIEKALEQITALEQKDVK